MDNRWRFLYYVMTELWGHGQKMRAGKGKTGASGGGAAKEKPCSNPEPRCGANQSSEAHGLAVEKSRYRS